MNGRPLIVIPPGIKAAFMRAMFGECGDDVVPFAEIREIDPTHPGDDDFIDALNMEGIYALDDDFYVDEEPRPSAKIIDFNKWRGQSLHPRP